MPRDIQRRYSTQGFGDACSGDPREQKLAGIMGLLNRCFAGERPPKQEMLGAMHTLLGMIGEEKRARRARTLGPQQPVDVQYPMGNRLIGNEVTPEEPVEGMEEIMDEMGVPQNVRSLAPKFLGNIVQNTDGTFSSADGSVHLSDIEKVKLMMGRLMQEIAEELRHNTQFNVDIDDGLNAKVITRDNNGRRREIVIDAEEVQ